MTVIDYSSMFYGGEGQQRTSEEILGRCTSTAIILAEITLIDLQIAKFTLVKCVMKS